MTMIVPTEVGVTRLTAVFLRGHLRLMARGMTHSRISKTQMLRKAEAITGKKYKRGQHEQAAEDITEWLEANK